jgi:hypothetical protein
LTTLRAICVSIMPEFIAFIPGLPVNAPTEALLTIAPLP